MAFPVVWVALRVNSVKMVLSYEWGWSHTGSFDSRKMLHQNYRTLWGALEKLSIFVQDRFEDKTMEKVTFCRERYLL